MDAQQVEYLKSLDKDQLIFIINEAQLLLVIANRNIENLQKFNQSNEMKVMRDRMNLANQRYLDLKERVGRIAEQFGKTKKSMQLFKWDFGEVA